jgi:hypothetical protein
VDRREAPFGVSERVAQASNVLEAEFDAELLEPEEAVDDRRRQGACP